MNRKLIEDQKNDISIIIGNLPKRLQMKIAAETGSSFADEQNANNAEVHVGTRIVQGNLPARSLSRDAAAKNYHFMQASESAVQANKLEQRHVDTVAIPGILRLNTALSPVPKKDSRVGRKRDNEHVEKQSPVLCRVPLLKTGQERPKCSHPFWFKQLFQKDDNYLQLPDLYDQLLETFRQKTVLESWSNFCEYHSKLQNLFAHLLLNQLKFCCEQKVDTFFWKLLFYNVIEHLKEENSSTQAIIIINNGLEFYSDLLVKLDGKYGTQNQNPQSQHKFEFIIKVFAQKLLICLGDLSRYKSKLLNLNDFSASYNFYQRAQKLIPSNGIPYNQLAVLAIYNRKKLDAVYFHMRSLMASNAIYSARESLHVLFDEIRKKYEESELHLSPAHNDKAKTLERKSKSLRKEVWIHPDGVRHIQCTDLNDDKSTATDEHHLDELTTEEILRRFTTLYLYILGKLFTGIGMETIQEHQRKLFLQLRLILKRNPLVISTHRILKIVGLNIFVMEHNKEKETRREIRYRAFMFCKDIFGLLLQKSNELFTAYTGETLAIASVNDIDFQDLNTLLKYAKIWCGWLENNLDILDLVRNDEQSLFDPWSQLVVFLDNVQKVLVSKDINCNDCADTVLEEDVYLAGFTPISKSCATHKCDLPKSDNESQFYARLFKLAKFKACYMKHSERLDYKNDYNFSLEKLKTDITNVIETVKTVDYEDDNNSENIDGNGCQQNQVVKRNSNGLNGNTGHKHHAQNAQVSELSKLKKELEAKSNVKKKYSEKLEEILKFVDTKLYIEVRPKYLLPDTNCFIDCLEDFEKFVHDYKRYILIIPLTVIRELDGLSKGFKIESYKRSVQNNRIHHFDDVSTRAKKSLNFITTTHMNVKYATTKGSIINASLFALVEEEHASNDDKILATALALSKTLSNETNKDGKCFIQTELVLITTDRNLRVKALSRNLAVSDLSHFQKWANHCQ